MTSAVMYSNKKTAHIAGLLYLVVVLTGIFSLAYVPSELIVWGNAAKTVANVGASQTLFRLGIASSLVCYTFFILLPLALYQLLSSVNAVYAKLMVILSLVSVPISILNLSNKFAVLSLTSGSEYLKVFSNEQLQAQVLFYLNQYDDGILILHVFWGLWLLPFGYLVFKSGFLPRVLGILLMLGCFGYLINLFGNVLIDGYSKIGVDSYVQ
ncbi:MAG: DUF4386 domain-containing protein, partial [Usitatibacteraceae bacterium]